MHHSSSGKKSNIQYISCELTSNTSNNNDINNGSQHLLATVTQPSSIIPADNYSYVQLTAVHDYNYPVVDDPISSVLRRSDSTCSLKKRPDLHIMKDSAHIKTRMRCRFVILIDSTKVTTVSRTSFSCTFFIKSLETCYMLRTCNFELLTMHLVKSII